MGMTDEEFATALMDLATEFNIAYAKKMAENGADTMVIIDPTASAMLIGDEYYEKYVVPAHRKIVDAMHEMNVPVVIHICGDTTMSLELMESSGVDAISVDQSVDIATAKSKVNKAMIIGNLDPVAVLWKGTPDTVRGEYIHSSIHCIGGHQEVGHKCLFTVILLTHNFHALCKTLDDRLVRFNTSCKRLVCQFNSLVFFPIYYRIR